MSTTLLPFAQLPGEVLMDKRLTPTHIRVLIALYMHRNKKLERVWPRRETLAALTGLHVSKISRATTELEQLGWVTKTGKGGRSVGVDIELLREIARTERNWTRWKEAMEAATDDQEVEE